MDCLAKEIIKSESWYSLHISLKLFSPLMHSRTTSALNLDVNVLRVRIVAPLFY